MMTIFIFFNFLFFSLSCDDCQVFYNKTLLDRNVESYIVEKKETDSLYQLKFSGETEDNTISFLKNKTGKDIFDFAIVGSFVTKKKGSLMISILSPTKDGGYNGRKFPDLCK